jgi:hypothetical protein
MNFISFKSNLAVDHQSTSYFIVSAFFYILYYLVSGIKSMTTALMTYLTAVGGLPRALKTLRKTFLGYVLI